MDGLHPATLGRLGERLACEHYERLGLRILARNARNARGELDLVAHGAGVIVFAEVKTRRASPAGAPHPDPLAAITPRTLRRMRAAAALWLAQAPAHPRAHALRLDAVAVLLEGTGALVSLEVFEDIG